jgi:hypothetical protein
MMRLTIGLLLASVSAAFAEPVSFNRDIRPIMSDTCFHCHGFDAKTREAGLRLDMREEAIRANEDGIVPIVPGRPDESEIIARIFDSEDPMPPESAHKPLTDRQKALFKQWVSEGAVYEPHWAYAPLKKPTPPPGAAHPIDAFVQAKLDSKGLQPSPAAPLEVLQRRVSLDLTGLPYSAHPGRETYETLVDALLASPHFGERMAVWWLDVARFADTVGFHGDQNQRIFPYRDYVINAFNVNKGFDQFTREQLAGDLLPQPTTDQLVATGYNRLNMMTREGGAQAQEYLAKYGAERVRSVAAAWFGSTFGCAECHDHKFDPIKTRDFYELKAFFADVRQWGVYSDYGYSRVPELAGFNNDFPFPPEVQVESPWLKKQATRAKKATETHLNTTVQRLLSDSQAAAARGTWEAKLAPFLKAHPDGWTPVAPGSMEIIGADGKPIPGRTPPITVTLDKALGKEESIEIPLAWGGAPTVAAFRIELAPEGLAPETLTARLGKSLSVTAKLNTTDGKTRVLRFRAGDATAKSPVYQGGSELPGLSNTWRLPKELPTNGKLQAIWVLETPVSPAPGEQLVAVIGGDNLLPMRFAVSPVGALEPLQVNGGALAKIIPTPPGNRTPAQEALVWRSFLLSTTFDAASSAEAHRLAAEARTYFDGKTWSLITQPVANPLPVRVLPRGNWQDESGALVLPSTPSFLPGRMESTEAKRLTRLDLANWLVSPQNPITARAVMNRLWAQFFGIGLSAAVDDLGSQGELPSHPELLDWLASEFRDSGWDMKHMIRLIVTSETYRQSSRFQPKAMEIDPANRLLASQTPRRLEAEFVRDNALAIAALLNAEDIGGPSVKPYQPEGYYEALQFPNRDYVADTNSRQWRRSLYMHWQRTFLHPMLANFDAPARDECAAARTVSNTPQQALTLLNDPIFVEAARVFAARLLQDKAPASDEERLALAFQLALNRAPKAQESGHLIPFLQQQRQTFTATATDTEKVLSIGIAPQPELPPAELAAWTQVARVLLNSQEVLTRY